MTDIKITGVKPVADPDPEIDDQLLVTLDKYGDFSTYTLGLVGVSNIDPRYQEVDFNFKVNCPSDLDCAPVCQCEPEALAEPEINYLAKDYASFRQLILDRLALLVPEWKERHIPDLGITLVELLAYTGDYLSYFQDAVATESYLDTARQRISVRRHARLVDYKLSEGCNARAWVCILTDSDFSLDPMDVSFTTGFEAPQLEAQSILHWSDLRTVPANSYEVFEVMSRESGAQLQFYAAQSEIHFYTWGERQCCLERGSTSATLLNDSNLQLEIGDVLIFEEVLGPVTGNPADADPTRRHAVRLTEVTAGEDRLRGSRLSRSNGPPKMRCLFPSAFLQSVKRRIANISKTSALREATSSWWITEKLLGRKISARCRRCERKRSANAPIIRATCKQSPAGFVRVYRRFH